VSCVDNYWPKDVDNLRISGQPCDYVVGINFGLVDIAYTSSSKESIDTLTLKIMDGEEEDMVKQEVTVDVDTCEIV